MTVAVRHDLPFLPAAFTLAGVLALPPLRPIEAPWRCVSRRIAWVYLASNHSSMRSKAHEIRAKLT